jgi:hypothetical protein
VSSKVRLGAEVKYVIGTEDSFDVKGDFNSVLVQGWVSYSF